MIINYPTGFYKSILPPAPSANGNITSTISNNPPPRGTLFFFKITFQLAKNAISLIPSEHNAGQINGSLKSFRSSSVSSVPIRPIGTVIEFNDSYNETDFVSPVLDQRDDFNKFGVDTTDNINNKLIAAYRKFKDKLTSTVQQLQNSYVQLSNYDRDHNSYVASLSAVNQALLIDPVDQDLLDIQAELQQNIDSVMILINDTNAIIKSLTSDKVKYEDSIRGLVKVIK
jgi:hypothetical protein